MITLCDLLTWLLCVICWHYYFVWFVDIITLCDLLTWLLCVICWHDYFVWFVDIITLCDLLTLLLCYTFKYLLLLEHQERISSFQDPLGQNCQPIFVDYLPCSQSQYCLLPNSHCNQTVKINALQSDHAYNN